MVFKIVVKQRNLQLLKQWDQYYEQYNKLYLKHLINKK